MMRTVRKFVVVATVVMTLALSACTGSTTSAPPLPTSPKAVAALLGRAGRMSLSTMTVTYQILGAPNTHSHPSTVFVAQREKDLASGQPSQLPDLAYREPAEAGSATYEYFAPPWASCQRQNARTRWTCQFVPDGNGPGLESFHDDWPQVLAQALTYPEVGRASDDGYKVIEGKRLPCFRFGHTTRACFFPNGLIGYYSSSGPYWSGTTTLLSYSPRVSANAFVPPVKPAP
jgi:hypothetical protein